MPRWGVIVVAIVTLLFASNAAAAVLLSPTSATVPPKGTVFFVPSGGATPYAFSLLKAPSGGVVSVSGNYIAGTTGDVVDIVHLVDSAGQGADAVVHVGSAAGITPGGAKIAPRETIHFTATGGSGSGYQWTVDAAGTIEEHTGVFVAGAIPAITVVRVTDSLGNAATALVEIGSGITLTPPVEANVAPGGHLSFAAMGGSGVYMWSLAPGPSGGTIDTSGAYVAGGTGGVTDVVTARDPLENEASVSVHVTPNVKLPEPVDAGVATPVPTSTTAPVPTSTAAHSGLTLGGGGQADNACDCGVVGARNTRPSWLALALAALFGLVFIARRRHID